MGVVVQIPKVCNGLHDEDGFRESGVIHIPGKVRILTSIKRFAILILLLYKCFSSVEPSLNSAFGSSGEAAEGAGSEQRREGQPDAPRGHGVEESLYH